MSKNHTQQRICTKTGITNLHFFTQGNSRRRAAGVNSRGALRFAPLCTHTEHLLLAVLRQHRTKNALRLSTAYACSFSVILHKTRLITVRLTALVLHILTKKLAAHLRHYLCAVLP